MVNQGQPEGRFWTRNQLETLLSKYYCGGQLDPALALLGLFSSKADRASKVSFDGSVSMKAKPEKEDRNIKLEGATPKQAAISELTMDSAVAPSWPTMEKSSKTEDLTEATDYDPAQMRYVLHRLSRLGDSRLSLLATKMPQVETAIGCSINYGCRKEIELETQ